jgi:hypothetical protein
MSFLQAMSDGSVMLLQHGKTAHPGVGMQRFCC